MRVNNLNEKKKRREEVREINKQKNIAEAKIGSMPGDIPLNRSLIFDNQANIDVRNLVKRSQEGSRRSAHL